MTAAHPDPAVAITGSAAAHPDLAAHPADLAARRFGIFGAGRLGRALAARLLERGIARQQIGLCSRDAPSTIRALAAAGLSDLTQLPAAVMAHSDVVFYTVRPQDWRAVAGLRTAARQCFFSFLAGIPIARFGALGIPGVVRVMTSAPETIQSGSAIAGLHPGDDPVGARLLSWLGFEVFAMQTEGRLNVFTALGPCLPVALTHWEALGQGAPEPELLELALAHGLDRFADLLRWAHRIRPRHCGPAEWQAYVDDAATPGGITAAIVAAIDGGCSLPQALQCGIERSHELAALG